MLENLLSMYDQGYYNLLTTFINIIVGFSLFYWFVSLVENHKINLKSKMFWKGSIGWVIAGVIVRLYADTYTLAMPLKLFFITPFIYVETIALAYLAYILLPRVWSYTGYVLGFLALFGLLHGFKFLYWQYALAAILISAIFYYVTLALSQDAYLSFAYAMQMLDASTTFLSITFRGFYEEHVLGRALMRLAENANLMIMGSGAWAFFIAKAVVIGLLLYYLKKHHTSSHYYLIILYFAAILGLAVGLRNLINLMFL